MCLVNKHDLLGESPFEKTSKLFVGHMKCIRTVPRKETVLGIRVDVMLLSFFHRGCVWRLRAESHHHYGEVNLP